MNTNTTANATTSTAIAKANADLLSYLKGAEVGMAIVAINLGGAADIDGELQGMAEVVGTIRGLLGELVEDLVEKMDESEAIDQAIEAWDAEESDRQEAEAYAEAEANMGEAADEAVVEVMRERLLGNAAWAAANPDLAAPGFRLDILWMGLGNPTSEEVAEIVRGNPGATSAEVSTIHPQHFDEEGNFVASIYEHADRFGHDLVAGDFSQDQAFQLGIAVAREEEPFGVRFAVRKDGGGFLIFTV